MKMLAVSSDFSLYVIIYQAVPFSKSIITGVLETNRSFFNNLNTYFVHVMETGRKFTLSLISFCANRTIMNSFFVCRGFAISF